MNKSESKYFHTALRMMKRLSACWKRRTWNLLP